MRNRYCPPCRREYSQLKSAVRTPPMWRNPVGLGANLVRTATGLRSPLHTCGDREVVLLGPELVTGGNGDAELVDAENVRGQAQGIAKTLHGLGDERVEHDHQVLEHVEGRVKGVAAALLRMAIVVRLPLGEEAVDDASVVL